ncbi:MAG: hypothetical protein ACYTG4_05720 [Planctomycetota bacterium]|jgi:hypothetical protein
MSSSSSSNSFVSLGAPITATDTTTTVEATLSPGKDLVRAKRE